VSRLLLSKQPRLVAIKITLILPFDRLSVSSETATEVSLLIVIPFALSLSKHKKTFYKILPNYKKRGLAA
jgi:hypothetical protein